MSESLLKCNWKSRSFDSKSQLKLAVRKFRFVRKHRSCSAFRLNNEREDFWLNVSSRRQSDFYSFSNEFNEITRSECPSYFVRPFRKRTKDSFEFSALKKWRRTFDTDDWSKFSKILSHRAYKGFSPIFEREQNRGFSLFPPPPPEKLVIKWNFSVAQSKLLAYNLRRREASLTYRP